MTDIQDHCALCGYPTRGDFYVALPGHFDGSVMHSIGCGPVLNGDQLTEPTHRRVKDMIFVRRGRA